MDVKYPSITVRLVGQNGNIFNLIGITEAALKRGHVPKEERDQFLDALFNAESYDEALQIIMKTVNVT